ncbi:hypothetical protein FBR01_07970 [Anaerolineae bacterium CFX8]|nr:hypothetical protein [Anaerolineae bacterium CFX8]
MIVRCLVLLWIGLILSGCQAPLSSRTDSPTAAASQPPSPEATVEPTPAEWVEQEVGGVLIGIEKPRGWEVQKMDDGILLAERFGSIASGGSAMPGIQVHIFVHSAAGFQIPDGQNAAWSILEQIVHDQKYMGRAHVEEPYGFAWEQHDAAYYLSNNGDGNMTMLIALVLPGARQMVVCNISSPVSESTRIRAMLPAILGSMTVNSVRLGAAALDALPDPLIFPLYPPRLPETPPG